MNHHGRGLRIWKPNLGDGSPWVGAKWDDKSPWLEPVDSETHMGQWITMVGVKWDDRLLSSWRRVRWRSSWLELMGLKIWVGWWIAVVGACGFRNLSGAIDHYGPSLWVWKLEWGDEPPWPEPFGSKTQVGQWIVMIKSQVGSETWVKR